MTENQLIGKENLEELDKDALIEIINKERREKNTLFKKRAKLGLSFETPNNRKALGKSNPDENIAEIVRNNVPYLKRRDDKTITTDENAITHTLIKGDNFPALLALHAEYRDSIDVIYIDPPYNTGNKDFIYNDRYVDKEDGFRHSRWLGFMARRLLLAQELLSENGVIFVSIDDNEQAHLKILMDEIFGAENFVGNMVWKKKSTNGGSSKEGFFLNEQHEYILMYSKQKGSFSVNGVPAGEELIKKYKQEDEHGKYRLVDLAGYGLTYQKSLDYEIEDPNGRKVRANDVMSVSYRARWRWSESLYQSKKEEVVWINGKPKTKTYLDKNGKRVNPNSILDNNEFLSNTSPNRILESLFGETIFSNPKPVSIVKYLLEVFSLNNATVLDFFAGSGTTGHAVAALNAEDGGTRKCILVTDAGKSGNANNSDMSGDDDNSVDIAEDITYERMRRVLTGKDWANSDKATALNQNLEMLEVEFMPRFITRYNEGTEIKIEQTDFELQRNLRKKIEQLGYEYEEAQFFAEKIYNRWVKFADSKEGDLAEWD